MRLIDEIRFLKIMINIFYFFSVAVMMHVKVKVILALFFLPAEAGVFFKTMQYSSIAL